MVRDKKVIIQVLATKYNLSLKKVEDIVNHQFKFVKETIQKGDFDSVRLPYFGRFSVNPKRVEYINKLKNESS